MAIGIIGMLLQILQVMIAIPFFFFVPGYFLTSIIFRKRYHQPAYEKMALSICFSLGINLVLGLALAFAKIFTTTSVWIGMIAISVVLAAIYAIIVKWPSRSS